MRLVLWLFVCVGAAGMVVGCGDSEAETESVASASEVQEVSLTPIFHAGDSAVFLHTELSRKAQASSLHAVTREVREARRFRLETLETEPDGVTRLRVVMERVVSSVTDNGEVVFEFDSQTPEEGDSGPARARMLLAGLVAELTVAPGGTVLGMSANLTATDLAGLPANQRPLFAENWFRSVIESLYRPFGERSVFPIDEVWEENAPPGSPFVGDEHVLVRESRVVEAGGEWVDMETGSVLYTAGVAKPENYSGVTRSRWSVREGRLESLRQRQVVRIDRPIAGTEGRDTAVREISLERINPSGPVDDKEER